MLDYNPSQKWDRFYYSVLLYHCGRIKNQRIVHRGVCEDFKAAGVSFVPLHIGSFSFLSPPVGGASCPVFFYPPGRHGIPPYLVGGASCPAFCNCTFIAPSYANCPIVEGVFYPCNAPDQDNSAYLSRYNSFIERLLVAQYSVNPCLSVIQIALNPACPDLSGIYRGNNTGELNDPTES